jgi:hypothetical protein
MARPAGGKTITPFRKTEEKYFCEKSLTRFRKISPSGKSAGALRTSKVDRPGEAARLEEAAEPGRVLIKPVAN